MIAEPSELTTLQWSLEEHFEPGQPVELLVRLSREIHPVDLEVISQVLTEGGLQLLSAPAPRWSPWPNTLRLYFTRPQRQDLSSPLATLLGKVLEPLGWETVSYTPRGA